MASKRPKTKTASSAASSRRSPAKGRSQAESRAQARARQKRKRSQRTGLLLGGAVVLAVAVVAGLALLNGGGTGSNDQESLDKSRGAENAPVVVVEYADFQCPYCGQFAKTAEKQLETEYVATGKVRFVYRHFSFIGDESFAAAEASECANEQGRFWEYHDKLFESQGAENSGAFAQDKLKQFAADLQFDTARFNDCLDSGKYRSKVRQETAEAQQRRLDRTPSILVNGQLITNGSDYAVLKPAIEAALAGQ